MISENYSIMTFLGYLENNGSLTINELKKIIECERDESIEIAHNKVGKEKAEIGEYTNRLNWLHHHLCGNPLPSGLEYYKDDIERILKDRE